MLTSKPYLFYLVDTRTGFAYYRDKTKSVAKAPISLGLGDMGVDISINDPNGWMNSTLGFMRNAQTYGLNRSYTVPQELVKDAAYIYRTVTGKGKGVQEPMTLIIFQYNASPLPGEPNYKFFYKGILDVPNAINTVGEGVQVNLIEGGFQQLYKTAENTVFEIPCDGSIPENIRVNLDGMLVENKVTYNFVPMQGTGAPSSDSIHLLAMSKVGQDGDSYGVINNDQQYDSLTPTYPQTSNNYTLGFQNKGFNSDGSTTATFEGTITVRPFNGNHPFQFSMGWFTSKAQGNLLFGPGFSGLGIPNVGTVLAGANQQTTVWVTQETTFDFKFSVNLSQRENIFLMWSDIEGSQNAFIVAGSCTVTYNTAPPATKVWAITWFDAFKLLVRYMCQTYSTNGIIYNYDFDSTLLKNNLNLVLTSGDALRAAGDPRYQKFYNARQTNPNYPNINLVYSYGPVLKTSIAECFRAVNAVLNASMSTQILPGKNESVFVESKGYVFDSTVVNLDNGEVSELKTVPATDLLFTLLRIGYDTPVSDQKGGKWSWCSTADWVSPINTIPSKTFELKCPYIADPFIIQRLIADIDDTSYTRNSSDNSVFILNTDPKSSTPDSESAVFSSPAETQFPANPGQAGNTNAQLITGQMVQPLMTPYVTGSYFSFSSDPAIFLFNQVALAGVSMSLRLQATVGELLGQPANALNMTPADSAVFKLWVNGLLQQTWTFTSASLAAVPIAFDYTFNRNWSFKDSVYITCATSAGATVQGLGMQMTIDDGNPVKYLVASGSAIQVDPGTPAQLIALPTVNARGDGSINVTPVISSGLQYFQFNTFLLSSEDNFDVDFLIKGFIHGDPSGQGSWDIYVNGQVVHTFTWASTAAVSAIADKFSLNRNFQLGDVLWVAASCRNTAVLDRTTVWITECDITFTSTDIFALDLLRVQYEAISGIPCYLGNLTMPGVPIPGRTGVTPPVETSVPITTGPGAPFNLQQLTTKQMLMAHSNYLAGVFYDQVGSQLQFSTMPKNQNLSITYKGVTYQDNQSVAIAAFGAPLFKAKWLTYKTRVQETYAETLTGAYNAHGRQTFNMVPFYGFPWELKQKPALNEMQEWKMLCSPLTDTGVLDNLNIDGVNFLYMSPNSIWTSPLNTDQWVPEGVVLPRKYHNYPRNQSWYSEQISNWLNQTPYWTPVQVGDPHPVQLYTRDLTQVILTLYTDKGVAVQTVNMTDVSAKSAAIVAPVRLWEASIDTTGLVAGGYYLRAVGGNGAATAVLISEGWQVLADQPKTIALEYTHSLNKESLIFDTGFVGFFRVPGMFDNTAEQKFKAAFYTDQRQSSQPLNSFRYEVSKLFLGMRDGVPDWVFAKAAAILLCDGLLIEGQGYTINEGDEWEPVRLGGNPKSFQKIGIRPSTPDNGVGATVTGADTDTSMLITLDQGAFSPNAGNLGGTDPDIIQVKIQTS